MPPVEGDALVEELEGVSPCFSASTAVAGVIKLVRNDAFPRSDTVLINLTGSDRQPAEISSSIRWLRRSGNDWIPESVLVESLTQSMNASAVTDGGSADGKH